MWLRISANGQSKVVEPSSSFQPFQDTHNFTPKTASIWHNNNLKCLSLLDSRPPTGYFQNPRSDIGGEDFCLPILAPKAEKKSSG
jgi:hypothetical protein